MNLREILLVVRETPEMGVGRASQRWQDSGRTQRQAWSCIHSHRSSRRGHDRPDFMRSGDGAGCSWPGRWRPLLQGKTTETHGPQRIWPGQLLPVCTGDLSPGHCCAPGLNPLGKTPIWTKVESNDYWFSVFSVF